MKLDKGVTVYSRAGKFTKECPDELIPQKAQKSSGFSTTKEEKKPVKNADKLT